MDIVEFAETYYGCELPEWQKEYLRTLDKLCKDGHARVVVNKGVARVYFKYRLKELLNNGKTNDSKH